MSFTMNKLKMHLNKPKIQEPTELTRPAQGTLESEYILYKIRKCGYTVVKGVSVPITTSGIPAPVSPNIAPASVTTSKLIEATLLANVSTTDPTTRFSEFFPAPIPPPRYLQPGYVKYNFNSNRPAYKVPPCIGYGTVQYLN